MGIISSQDWKEIAKLYSNEETSAATRAGLCHNNNDHIPHLVQCPGLYRAHVYREARARYMQRTVQYIRAPHCHRVSRSVSRSVTHCYLVLHSVTCHERSCHEKCLCSANEQWEGSHGHIANIVAAYNVTLQHIYNWQVNALSVRRFSECLFLQAVRNLQNLVDIAKTHINYRNICRETDVE